MMVCRRCEHNSYQETTHGGLQKALHCRGLLADGKIDDTEVKVIKKELYADGKIDKSEVAFLIDLRNAAQKKAAGGALSTAFENLFFKAISDNVLKDGVIDAKEAKCCARCCSPTARSTRARRNS